MRSTRRSLLLGMAASGLTGSVEAEQTPLRTPTSPSKRAMLWNLGDLASVGAHGQELAQASEGTRLATTPGIDYRFAPAAWLRRPVDLTNGKVIIDFREVTGFNFVQHWGVELFSQGSTEAPGPDYLHTDTARSGPAHLGAMRTAISGVHEGRNQSWDFPTGALVRQGAGADLKKIIGFRLRVRSSAPAIGHLKGLFFQRNGFDGAKVMFRFDDLHACHYSEAFPLLRAAGFKAILAPGAYNRLLGRFGRCTPDQVREMIAAGWEIMLQADDNETSSLTVSKYNAAVAFAKAHGGLKPGFMGSYYSRVGPNDAASWEAFGLPPGGTAVFQSSRAKPGAPPKAVLSTYPWADKRYVIMQNAEQYVGDDIIAQRWAPQFTAAKAQKALVGLGFHKDLRNLRQLVTAIQADEEIRVIVPSQLPRT